MGDTVIRYMTLGATQVVVTPAACEIARLEPRFTMSMCCLEQCDVP